MPAPRALRAAAAVALATTAGCYVSIEPATRFEGDPRTFSVPYASGTTIHVVSANGNVTVIPGTASDTAKVTFAPFVMDKDNNEAGARDQMNSDLVLFHGTDSGGLLFRVSRRDGSSSSLGADITVALPAGFDGAFDVDQANGDTSADLRGGAPLSTSVASKNGGVTVVGAAGPLAIDAGNGPASVLVSGWGEGHVTLGNGDLDFAAPVGASGTIQALAKSGVVDDTAIPSSWAVASAGDGSKSYTMGDGTGGLVTLTTDLGDIALSAK